MSAPLPTRQQIDAAAPLDFDQKRQPERAAEIAPRAYPARSYAITATSPAGFQIVITLNDIRLDALDDALAALLDRGYLPYEPPAPAAPNPTTAAPTPQTPTGVPPLCPLHNRPMKVSNYGGWFCTFADPATGEKCKQKVK